MTEITGSCRCGQYHYVLSTAPVFAAYCHCTDCRKRNSSPCTSLVMADSNSMSTTGDYQQYSEIGGSGHALDIHRCSHCGTALFMQVQALDNIAAVPAETLHDMHNFQPQGHMWTGSKEKWLEINDGLPQMAGAPRLPKEFFK